MLMMSRIRLSSAGVPTGTATTEQGNQDMKKMLLVALLGLGLTLTSGRPASAWCKFNFGVGLNINYEGGGNSVLWGLLKGAPSPPDQQGGVRLGGEAMA